MPPGFDLLRAEARAEGHRHLERLAEEWSAHTMRFDREGEALLAARLDADLVGIGGLTIDPSQAGALRMRRFHVGKSFRRNGTGRAIAEKLLAHARASGRLVTVNAAAALAVLGVHLGAPQRPHACYPRNPRTRPMMQ
jgi:GNAT superfamily N-acetyltransferase